MIVVSPFLLYFLPIASIQRRQYYFQIEICSNLPSISYQNKTFHIFGPVLFVNLPTNCFPLSLDYVLLQYIPSTVLPLVYF